jgi:predicted nuclease of predicted toxin-antitoxin system
MIFWLNAQLPPSLAEWLSITFCMSAVTLQDIGLSEAQDIEIFNADRANSYGTVVITKDRDFIDLVVRLGSPQQIL